MKDESADALHMMFRFKVVSCPIRYAHDWTACPGCHPGERARRRAPSTHTGIACLSMRQEGTCSLGDACPFAHNVFEYWLHPTRYRTALCKNGANCTRPFCFFPHHPWELRTNAPRPMLPPQDFQDPLQQQEAAAAAGCAPPSSSIGCRPIQAGARGGISRQLAESDSVESRQAAGAAVLGRAGECSQLSAGVAAAAGEAPGPAATAAAAAAAGMLADHWDMVACINSGIPSSTWSTGSSSPRLQDPPMPVAYDQEQRWQQQQQQQQQQRVTLDALPRMDTPPPPVCARLPASLAQPAPKAKLSSSWAVVQAVDDAVSLGRMDSHQASLVLARLLPESVLLQLNLEVQLQGQIKAAAAAMPPAPFG